MTDNFNHIYIYIKGKSSDKCSYEWGHIVYNTKGIPKRKIDQQSLDHIDFFDKEIDGKQTIDIYVHGMWANMNTIWQQQHKNLHPHLVKHYSTDQNRVFVSLMWDCKFEYFKNVHIAKFKGKMFSGLFKHSNLTSLDRKINILAHSMGGKVTEYFLKYAWNAPYRINHLILFGSDLDQNVFSTGHSLHYIHTKCDHVTVYHNTNDNILKISEFLNSSKRLGQDGCREKQQSIEEYDINDLLDSDNELSYFEHHQYFHTSDVIIQHFLDRLSRTKASVPSLSGSLSI